MTMTMVYSVLFRCNLILSSKFWASGGELSGSAMPRWSGTKRTELVATYMLVS